MSKLLYSLWILSSNFLMAETVASLVSGNFLMNGFPPSHSMLSSGLSILSLLAENKDLCF